MRSGKYDYLVNISFIVSRFKYGEEYIDIIGNTWKNKKCLLTDVTKKSKITGESKHSSNVVILYSVIQITLRKAMQKVSKDSSLVTRRVRTYGLCSWL